MTDPRPEKCLPWPKTLVALLCREGGCCEQHTFLAKVREYFGSSRWEDEISLTEWDACVHAALCEVSDLVEVEGRPSKAPKLPLRRPRDRQGLGDLFLGLTGLAWSQAKAAVLWRLRRHPYFSWMMSAIERRMSPRDLVRQVLGDAPQATLDRWEHMVDLWCADFGEITPEVRYYRVRKGVPLPWSMVEKLGPNVTSFWIAHHKVVPYLNHCPTITRKFTISAGAGVLGEQIGDTVERKIVNNSCAKYLVAGTMSVAMFATWTKRTVINAIRDSGRNPATRALLGALTERERARGLERVDSQVAIDPEFLLDKLADNDRSPEVLDGVDLEDAVLERIATILSDESKASRMLSVFKAFYGGEDLDDIASNQGLSRAAVREMIGDVRRMIADDADDFLDMAGLDAEDFAQLA